jgi:AcrR family transcriptional regulator
LPVEVRERILEATFACVARYGLAKTTVEDAAREARLSRATVYRHFPGGREQLITEVVAWEAARFFARLAEAVAGAPTFGQLLEDALVFAHRAVEDHEVLQKMLQTEPELLTTQLTVGSGQLLGLVQEFLLPHLVGATLRPGIDPVDAAGYVARMVLSHISSPGGWDLTDRAQVRDLVRTELLAGIVCDE